MAGKRAFKKISFTHSGSAGTVSQVVEMPEGGAAGNNSIFMRRVFGAGSGHIEFVEGCFEAAGTNGYQLGQNYDAWGDTTTVLRWNDINMFPYLKITADFEEDTGTTEVELYIVTY